MRARVALLVGVATTCGCAALAGLHDYTSDDAASDAGRATADAADASIDTAAALPEAGDGAADAADATVPAATSCKTLLAAKPALFGQNGIYTIDPDGDARQAPFDVFCDMTLDRGGWTLVARSGAGGTDFGWSSQAGAPTDFVASYSMNVRAVGLSFLEILVTDLVPGTTDAASRGYKVTVPVGFLTNHANDLVATSNGSTVFGDCNNAGGPEMFRWAGATSRTDTFFFRDINGTDQKDGLTATGFSLTYAECNRSGKLDKQQGMLFVR